jgi:hypothetical protein
VRYPVSKTGGPRGLGGSTPSPSVDLEVWPSRQGSALLARRAPCVPQVRVLLPPLLRSGVVEQVRRAVVTREGQVRVLPPELTPPWSKRAMTPDSQSGSCGFESRRGCWNNWLWGSVATPPASGAGDRRFDSCRPDRFRRKSPAPLAQLSADGSGRCAVRRRRQSRHRRRAERARWRSGSLASLMSSRRGFESRPRIRFLGA